MRAARFRVRVAWAFAVPIAVWMLAEMFFGIVWPNQSVYDLGMILLALPVLFWVGWRTYGRARATFRKIKQSLFWAFFYNVVTIPAAIIGWMHPVLAEIAIATSSATVVGNANRLRRVDIRPSYQREVTRG